MKDTEKRDSGTARVFLQLSVQVFRQSCVCQVEKVSSFQNFRRTAARPFNLLSPDKEMISVEMQFHCSETSASVVTK